MSLREKINVALVQEADSTIKEAMNYSLQAKSKLLRSFIIEAMVQDYGFNKELAHTSGVALEMIQTYSLIHDDLPAMDDDDFRRNQLSNHKKFDEATAILAGDALLTKAFEVIVDGEYTSDEKVAIIKELSYASGASGMILGQHFDMSPFYLTSNNAILKMISLKTGMLFGAAFAIGAILSHQGDKKDNYRSIGQTLGVAFQIQDDLLEVEKTESELGKSKSDAKNQKITLLSFKGKEEAQTICNNAFNDVFESLSALNDHKHVVALIQSISKRGY